MPLTGIKPAEGLTLLEDAACLKDSFPTRGVIPSTKPMPYHFLKEGDCGICLKALPVADGEGVRRIYINLLKLACGHCFHEKCFVRHWLNQQHRDRCIQCRKLVVDEDEKLTVGVWTERGKQKIIDWGKTIDEVIVPELRIQARQEKFFEAIDRGCFDEVEALLKGEDKDSRGEKMNINIINQYGETALHFATRASNIDSADDYGDIRGIRLLLQHGADRSLLFMGRTALELALEQGLTEAAKALSQP